MMTAEEAKTNLEKLLLLYDDGMIDFFTIRESIKMAIEALRQMTETSDTIYRQAAIDAAEKESQVDDAYGYMDTKSIIDMLEALPSALPKTAKRIIGKSRDGMTMWYQCNMCNKPVGEKDTFCSGCGRRLVNG